MEEEMEIPSMSQLHSYTHLIDSQPLNLLPILSSPEPQALEQQQQQQQLYDISVQSLLKMKNDMDASFLNSFHSHLSSLSSTLSSSSDSGADSAHKTEYGNPTDSNGNKRKNKRKKMEYFVETLISQVTLKQEQMHHQLMEFIQNKERERICRELQWRHLETQRYKREEDLRSQETAKSLALISLIQSVLGGNQLETFPSVFTTSKGVSDYETHPAQDNGNRWPSSEVQALITLRAAFDHMFSGQGSKASAWLAVSNGMAAMGFTRGPNKCREKWDNINKYYKRVKYREKRRSGKAKACPYFHELESLFSTQIVTTRNDVFHTSDNAQLNEASVV